MKTRVKMIVRTMTLGLFATTLVASSASAKPSIDPAQSWKKHSDNAESHNVPRFKMTYRSLHRASLKRQKHAQKAAMELEAKQGAAVLATDR